MAGGHIRLVLISVEGNVPVTTEIGKEKYIASSDTSGNEL